MGSKFIILIVVMLSQACKYIKTYQSVHFKCVQYLLYGKFTLIKLQKFYCSRIRNKIPKMKF